MNTNPNKLSDLKFEEFFKGKVIARGNLILYYPKKSIKDLYVTFKGILTKNHLRLNEEYVENEKKIIRNWNFNKISNNLFHGTENNVKGTIVVNIENNRLHMNYYFKLVIWNFTITVLIKDKMYQISDKEIINTTHVSKFGIKLAEVILLYKKIS